MTSKSVRYLGLLRKDDVFFTSRFSDLNARQRLFLLNSWRKAISSELNATIEELEDLAKRAGDQK